MGINGDALAGVKSPADSGRLEVTAIQQYLNKVLKSQGLTYAYAVRMNAQSQVELIVDGSDDPEETGTIYDDAVAASALGAMYKTGETTVAPLHQEEGYGRLMTVYVPMKNKRGELVGAVAFDLEAGSMFGQVLGYLGYYLGAWALVVLAGLGFSVRLARRIAQRVTPLSAGARALAEGDLAVAVAPGVKAYKRLDELDDLRSSLSVMQESLNGLVAGLRNSAGQVVAATTGLMTAVGTVSSVADEAREAMEQVAGGTREQAGNASDLAGFFAQFSRSLEQFTAAAETQARAVAQAASSAGRAGSVPWASPMGMSGRLPRAGSSGECST
jgi:methyl-accepting chemotaxis protein